MEDGGTLDIAEVPQQIVFLSYSGCILTSKKYFKDKIGAYSVILWERELFKIIAKIENICKNAIGLHFCKFI